MMNKKIIFVDTGAWYAIADESDQFHNKAVTTVKKLVEDGFVMVTTNLVIHETFMLIARRMTRKAAIRFIDEMYHADDVQIVHSDRIVENDAFETIRDYSDQDFSITDCVSFVVMKREGLKRAFTFDKQFKIMRFTVEP